MNQVDFYFIFFLYTAAFCLAATLGLLFLLSRRSFGSYKKLQSVFGASMVLIAVHLLFLNFTLFFGDKVNMVFRYILVFLDIAFGTYCVVFVSRSLHKADMSPEQGKPERKESISEDVPSPEDEIAAEGEVIPEEGLPAESEEEQEESVEQLENPNVDDFLFFQKVEALMVNEMLFCEQELSREALATAIGTNRTYLARSIKSATGKTFSGYITDLRTAYAAKLLTTTDEPLDLIGSLVGFRSKSAYYRAFSAAYNCSPSEYRRNSVLRSLGNRQSAHNKD